MKKIAIFHSLKGGKYAEFLAKKVRARGVQTLVKPWTYLLPLTNRILDADWDIVHLRFGRPLDVIDFLSLQDIKFVNDPNVIRKTSNKFLGTLVARKAGIKVPDTIIIEQTSADSLNDLGLPLVIKPLMGSHGKDVFLVDSNEELHDKLRYMKTIYDRILVQSFVPHEKLIRAVIIGEEIIDAAFESPQNSWKASVCLNPNVKPYLINEELQEICIKLKQALGADMLVIDIFETKEGYVFNEINNACNLYPMYRATGVDHAQKICDYLISLVSR